MSASPGVADPELAVPGVSEELLGVAAGRRTEVQDRLVGAVLARLEHQHSVWLPIAAQAGQVGEGTMGPEDVVAVVAAHLQTASRYDERSPGKAADTAARRAAAYDAASARAGLSVGGAPSWQR